MVKVPFLRAYLGGFLGFWKPLKFWFAIESTIDHHSGIYYDVSINQQTILCLVAYIHAVTGQGVARHFGKGNLHYYSKESMHSKNLIKIEIPFNIAVSCSSNYSNRAFILLLGNPLWDTPLQ